MVEPKLLKLEKLCFVGAQYVCNYLNFRLSSLPFVCPLDLCPVDYNIRQGDAEPRE